MSVRFARSTARLDEVVAFYRDGLGLPEIGRFEGHDGYDGVFLEIPGTGAHLEFTAHPDVGAPDPHPETLLVLYLGSWPKVRQAVQRSGAETVPSANPYWDRNGVTVVDPDGHRVVLAAQTWRALR